jgi:hypothetical protein
VLVLKVSARLLVPSGMLLAAIGLYWLTHISVTGNYATVVLPATIIMGAGLGLVFAPGFNLAILGVRPDDAGVASASVNAVQQVGGSVGTALFNTLAASALASYLSAHAGSQPQKLLLANASLHSYTTAFWIATAVFAGGALISAALLRSGIAQPDPDVAPMAA